MSLPPTYNNFSNYLNDTLSFLHQYQWLYSIPNNRILTEKLLEHFPSEWHSHLQNLSTDELNNIPVGYTNDEWPDSLKDFIKKIESFKPHYNKYVAPDLVLPQQFFTGLSVKKKHEILSLAPFIHASCRETNIQLIIDIGAGLGYLPQLLYEKYGYKVLGVEANEKFIKTAEERQNKLYKNSRNSVMYVQHFVDENSDVFLNEKIQEYFDKTLVENGVCLIGLHACADLTITLLNLFRKMNNIQLTIVMPCCYHRLKQVNSNSSAEFFVNFPISSTMRSAYKSRKAANFLTSAFLRLACQNTASCWRSMSQEDHKIHSIGAMRRAVLQLVAEQEGYRLNRLKRKTHSTSHTTDFDSFQSYLDGLTHTHRLLDQQSVSVIDSQLVREQLTHAWHLHKNHCDLLEVYIAFQTSLQSVCENIVLLDRVEMMNDFDIECYTEKVTDESVSPRCYAHVARKH